MKSTTSELESKFNQEILDTCSAAAKSGYHPHYFMKMVSQKGGYEAARQLIRSSQPSEGFTKLWEKGLLGISVEAKVLLPEYHAIFSDEERELCRKRLADHGYQVPQ